MVLLSNARAVYGLNISANKRQNQQKYGKSENGAGNLDHYYAAIERMTIFISVIKWWHSYFFSVGQMGKKLMASLRISKHLDVSFLWIHFLL